MLCLADVGVIGPAARADRLTKFVEDGGIVVRFAGSRLAASQDDFTPVPLRRGGRILGGALSWEAPKKLAPFDAGSPFVGLRVPEEVTVTRQVLAEPDAGLPAKTWAHLADGTPLVTAERRGKGLLVLFHVTADTTWSNLPLSGLFPTMLRKIVSLSGEAATDGSARTMRMLRRAPPRRRLHRRARSTASAFCAAPPATAKPISAGIAEPAGPDHPPGFYGPPDASVAVNTLADDATARAARSCRPRRRVRLRSRPARRSICAVRCSSLAFLLLVADTLASLWLAGGLRLPRGARPSRRCCSRSAPRRCSLPQRPAHAQAQAAVCARQSQRPSRSATWTPRSPRGSPMS